MIGKAQLFVLAVLICSLLLEGCNPPDIGEKRQAPIPAEQQEARLLKRINRRFEDPEAHFELGRLYQSQGRWDEAEYHYDIAFSFDPVYWPAQAAKVRVLQERGNMAEAEWSAQNYIGGEVADSEERLLELGRAFQTQSLDKHALACYQQALRLAPDSAKVHRQIGYYYLSKDNKARAKEYFVRSFRIDPLQPEVAYELGRMDVLIRIPEKTKKNMKKSEKVGQQSEKKAKR
jgi:tetratricopeptide (TPR) repeat protein